MSDIDNHGQGDNLESHIAVFRGKEIRKTLYNKEWWFAIVDVVEVLTDSKDPSGYFKDMRRRDAELSKGWGQIATPLDRRPPEENRRLVAPTPKASLRIIQSIPSPKAEPFKRWLAKVGYEQGAGDRRPRVGVKTNAGHL